MSRSSLNRALDGLQRLLSPMFASTSSNGAVARGFSFASAQPAGTSLQPTLLPSFRSTNLGSAIQVRYNKREMRRMKKGDINYPVIPTPLNWKKAGWHDSWTQRFKVNLVKGVPTVLNKMPGFNHNRASKSHNRLALAGKWVETPPWYVRKMKMLGFRVTTTHKQKNSDRPRPYVPS